MAEFVYHAYFNHTGPPVPEDGTLYMELRSTVELDVGPIRQAVLDSGYLNLVTGAPLQNQNLVVRPIVGAHLAAVNANKPTHASKEDETFETWADHKLKLEVFNPEKYLEIPNP